MLNFKQYQAVARLKQLIPIAVRKIIGALSLANEPMLQVAHTQASWDPRRDEWNLLFSDPHEDNASFQEWTKQAPTAIFHWGTKGDRILTSYKNGGKNRVYFSLNNKVVKLTEDHEEASVVALILESGTIPSIAVEDVIGLQTFARAMSLSKLFAIKQRFVNTDISGELRKAINALDSFFNMQGPYNVIKNRHTPGYSARASMFHAEDLPHVRLILDVIFTILDKTGHLWVDLHAGNIAQDEKGEPVLFDLGVLYPADDEPRQSQIGMV